jgi:4-carboxymuconolactone decarboxylase
VSTFPDRLPLPSLEAMTDTQRAAANELIAGPRKAVVGPFIPLLRSPELMSRLQKVGEYLRFESALPPRISEFATLLVARAWSQQFEWAMHVPLARKAGTSEDTIAAIREGRRPPSMSPPKRGSMISSSSCSRRRASRSPRTTPPPASWESRA